MVSRKTQGKDFNFYQKISVNNSGFNYDADIVITFTTQGILFLNEGSGVVEYSFNGSTVHGELDSGSSSKGLIFDNRVVSLIWFRLKSGSSGPITVRVDAWATR